MLMSFKQLVLLVFVAVSRLFMRQQEAVYGSIAMSSCAITLMGRLMLAFACLLFTPLRNPGTMPTYTAAVLGLRR